VRPRAGPTAPPSAGPAVVSFTNPSGDRRGAGTGRVPVSHRAHTHRARGLAFAGVWCGRVAAQHHPGLYWERGRATRPGHATGPSGRATRPGNAAAAERPGPRGARRPHAVHIGRRFVDDRQCDRRSSWINPLCRHDLRPYGWSCPKGPSERSGETGSDPRSAAGLAGIELHRSVPRDRRSGSGRLRSHQRSSLPRSQPPRLVPSGVLLSAARPPAPRPGCLGTPPELSEVG
jgi:hypothetical protein